MVKKVLAFAASPRKNGNTETLLDSVMEGLHSRGIETVKYRTQELGIHPCVSCGFCGNLGECVINDSFTDIFAALKDCDGIVFSSPLYFMNVPSAGKALIDRCQAFWEARYLMGIDLFNERNRQGLLVACAGSRHGPGKSDVFRGLNDTMTYFFKSLGIDRFDSVLFSGVDEKGAINNVEGAVEKAFDAGAGMADKILNK